MNQLLFAIAFGLTQSIHGKFWEGIEERHIPFSSSSESNEHSNLNIKRIPQQDIFELKDVRASKEVSSEVRYPISINFSFSLGTTASEKPKNKPGPNINLEGAIRRHLTTTAARTNPELDMVCSPLSAYFPIAKLSMGSSGTMENEMETALGVNYYKDTSVFSRMLVELKSLYGIELSIASKIYIGTVVKLNNLYVSRISQTFKTSIDQCDFEREKTKCANDINKWVSKHTRGRIDKIIEANELGRDDGFVLVNAVLFNANWDKPFKSAGRKTFYGPHGPVEVPMMKKESSLLYANVRALDAQAISIYYKGKQVSFVMIVPNERKGLAKVLQRIHNNPQLLQNALADLSEGDYELTMPTFKIETKLDLKDIFLQLGLKQMFQPSNGFKDIANTPLFVSKVVQKAYIEVNENGTEAAAATVINVVMLSLVKYKEIVVDRPFLYYLLTNSGHQLFSGIYCGS